MFEVLRETIDDAPAESLAWWIFSVEKLSKQILKRRLNSPM